MVVEQELELNGSHLDNVSLHLAPPRIGACEMLRSENKNKKLPVTFSLHSSYSFPVKNQLFFISYQVQYTTPTSESTSKSATCVCAKCSILKIKRNVVYILYANKRRCSIFKRRQVQHFDVICISTGQYFIDLIRLRTFVKIRRQVT